MSEIGNLARNPDFSQGKKVIEPIMTLVLEWAMRTDTKICFLSSIPSHGEFYRRCGFKYLAKGEVRPHPKVNNILGVGMTINLSHVEAKYTQNNLHKYDRLARDLRNRLSSIPLVFVP